MFLFEKRFLRKECKEHSIVCINRFSDYRQNCIACSLIYDLIYDLFHSTGHEFYSCPEGKGTRGLQGPIQRCPTSPTLPFAYERQPQHRDHPTLFRIVRGFFYVPQNYQHSRNCETGPPTYRPYPRRLESLTICRWYYKGSTFSSVILRP